MIIETNNFFNTTFTSSRKFPDILFITSDAGGGHQSAVRALVARSKEISNNSINYTVENIINIIGPLGKILGTLFEATYNFGIQKGLYWFEPMLYNLLEKIRHNSVLCSTGIKPLANFLQKVRPDIIVSVIHGATEILYESLTEIKQEHNIPIIVVVTDPVSLRPTWVSPLADLIVVATEEAKQQCLSYGISENQIMVIGLPVNPSFDNESESKEQIRKSYNLEDKLFTVMLMMGGTGNKNIYTFSNLLNESGLPIQIIACCGKDEKLKSKMDNFSRKANVPITSLGFTLEIPNLMSASNVIVTKPGPGTIVEAISKDLPIIIDNTAYTMWQERGNVSYVKENNIGKVISKIEELTPTIKELVNDPNLYNQILQSIAQHKYLHATTEISQLILNYSRA